MAGPHHAFLELSGPSGSSECHDLGEGSAGTFFPSQDGVNWAWHGMVGSDYRRGFDSEVATVPLYRVKQCIMKDHCRILASRKNASTISSTLYST